MGYYIHDVNGYLGDGPSITGWQELRDEVLLPQGGDATKQFVEDGATPQVEKLRVELSLMRAQRRPTASSLRALQESVAVAREIVILTTGVGSPTGPNDLEDDVAYLTEESDG